jgi:plastocyanin
LRCKASVFTVASVAWPLASRTAPHAANPDEIDVHLSNFAFTPKHLHLHAGTMVTLHIVNDSNGGHNFSAPELFAASSFPAAPHPLHFLHSLFGLTGSIVVEAPAR